MYKGKKISITIPVFNEARFIYDVLSNITEFVDYIVVVDDASSDNSREEILKVTDSRIIKLFHDENQGVGKSTINGHQKGVELEADFLVRIDGDEQMDLGYLIPLLEPLLDENIHFTKGNRMKNKETRKNMPFFRLIGNYILSTMTQIMTGYHNISDPQNGYTAIKRDVFELLNKKRIKTNYIYENSILYELSEIGANIEEINMHSIYGKETSAIVYHKFIFSMLGYMFICCFKKLKKLLIQIFKGKEQKVLDAVS